MANTFLTEPFHIWWLSDAPRATNTAEGFWYATERVAEWLIGSVKWYAMDIINPGMSALRDVSQWVLWLGLQSERWENGRLKNLWLGLSWAVANTLKWTSNIALGLLGWSDKIYRNGVIDAHSELSAGTIDRLWQPGMWFGNLRRLGTYIGWIPTRTGNMLAKWIDIPFDWFQKVTRPARREAYQSGLRFR